MTLWTCQLMLQRWSRGNQCIQRTLCRPYPCTTLRANYSSIKLEMEKKIKNMVIRLEKKKDLILNASQLNLSDVRLFLAGTLTDTITSQRLTEDQDTWPDT